ncbi:inorganic phosphate transporter Pho88 [Lipomyces arxii]|uniref:inorganic phosphate transporter Pho88 n=1 Tax=Lipomyces arxii TaxID=56418 RepID=UPI0034CFA284
MNPAVTNLVVMLVLMQVSKKIPFEDPQVVMYARIAYLASNLFIFSLYMFARFKITKKNDLTTLKYVEPSSSPFGAPAQERKFVTTTVKEYDLQQVTTAIRSSFMGIAILLFMHFRLGYTNPLVMQSVLPIKSAFEQKIIQIHVMGKPAVGDLKRPFKAASMFGMPSASDFSTDKKAIDRAETSGAGGVKDE